MELGQLVHWNVFLKDTAIDLPWGCPRVFFQSLKTEQLQEPLYGEWICWIHFSWYRPAETSWVEGQTFSRKKIWVLAAERAELNYRALTIAWRLKELYLLALCLLGQEYVVYVSKLLFTYGPKLQKQNSHVSCVFWDLTVKSRPVIYYCREQFCNFLSSGFLWVEIDRILDRNIKDPLKVAKSFNFQWVDNPLTSFLSVLPDLLQWKSRTPGDMVASWSLFSMQHTWASGLWRLKDLTSSDTDAGHLWMDQEKRLM